MSLDPDLLSFDLFNTKFQDLNKASLFNAQIFPDALRFLAKINEMCKSIFISSSVPSQELLEITNRVLGRSTYRV